MTKPTPAIAAVLAATVLFAFCASAQYSTPPISTAELEAVYTAELEHRATNIIAALALTVDDPGEVVGNSMANCEWVELDWPAAR